MLEGASRGAALVGEMEDPALEPRVGHRGGRYRTAIGVAFAAMLEHVFLDAVGVLSQALDDALLERHRHEDRLASDILQGDLVWETTCSLPGDGAPPRVRADVTLDWPTWSQAAWRSQTAGEPVDEPPEIGIEVVLRVQRLAEPPDRERVLAVLPEESPPIGGEHLARSGPIIEESYETPERRMAIEVGYEGAYLLPMAMTTASKELVDDLRAMGGWIASALVRLGDLGFEYLPPDASED